MLPTYLVTSPIVGSFIWLYALSLLRTVLHLAVAFYHVYHQFWQTVHWLFNFIFLCRCFRAFSWSTINSATKGQVTLDTCIFFIRMWKFGISLGYGYYKNKLMQNLCYLRFSRLLFRYSFFFTRKFFVRKRGSNPPDTFFPDNFCCLKNILIAILGILKAQFNSFVLTTGRTNLLVLTDFLQ